MASTFTTAKLLEKQGNNDNSNTWDVPLNSDLDNIDSMTHGVGTKSVAGSSNVTLSDAEALPAVIKLTGILTGNINVVVPSRTGIYVIWNATTGSFTVTVKTSGGNGILVPQGTRRRLLCDATDVLDETIAAAPGHLTGLGLTQDTDADHDISIAIGSCADSTGVFMMALYSVLVKQLDATWTAGTNAGGRFSGVSLSASTWYHVFLIRKTSDGSIDAGFDTSASAANIPAGYVAFRRLGAVKTDGSSNIVDFLQDGDRFYWAVPPLDINTTNLTASAWTSFTVSGPLGVRTSVFGQLQSGSGLASEGADFALRAADASDGNPTRGDGSILFGPNTSSQDIVFGTWGPVLTNTSSQIAYYASNAGTLYLRTRGWIDRRGT